MRIEVISSCTAFKEMKASWEQVLQTSDADRLFMSWEWLYSWWSVWSNDFALSLHIITIYDDDKLVLIAPFCFSKRLSIPVVKGKKLQYIGSHWKESPSVRTEYFSPIVLEKYKIKAIKALAQYLKKSCLWDEFVVCDERKLLNSSSHLLLQELLHEGMIKFTWNVDRSYYLDTKKTILDYKNTIGKSTKKKYFPEKPRDELTSSSYYCCEELLAGELSNLNIMHYSRWEKETFDQDVINFYRLFCSTSRSKLKIRKLELDSVVISILLSIEVSSKEYYIQSGFHNRSLSGVSLGKYQLGIAIKDAFESKSTHQFDLLIGQGKFSPYKSFLTNKYVYTETYSVVKQKKLVFTFYQKLKKLKHHWRSISLSFKR